MLKLTLKLLTIVLVLVIIGIQFVRPEFNNPAVKKGERIQDVYSLPTDVNRILKKSCSDCHSFETTYPWYSGIAPLSWGMSDHIKLGREELNFSIWGTYSEKRRTRKLKQMCEEVESGNMPHYQYLWLHWDAVLSGSDKQLLCNWTKSVKSKVTPAGN